MDLHYIYSVLCFVLPSIVWQFINRGNLNKNNYVIRHMSGSVQYAQNNEMLVELYGEENEIISFMSVLEQYMKRQPNKVLEMDGEPDYGWGDFRIG